jgi:Skp family chaperone for outer membrane proteins
MNRIAGIVLSTIFLFLSPAALAGGIAVVDFQRAINEVKEGVTAKTKLDGMFQTKQQQLALQEQQLQQQASDYEQQKALLSAAARQEKEQVLMNAQMQLQQLAYQAESEMQQIYAQEMEGLIGKMREITETLGKEKDLDLILEQTESGLVYQGSSVVDLTDTVIKLYDEKYAH